MTLVSDKTSIGCVVLAQKPANFVDMPSFWIDMPWVHSRPSFLKKKKDNVLLPVTSFSFYILFVYMLLISAILKLDILRNYISYYYRKYFYAVFKDNFIDLQVPFIFDRFLLAINVTHDNDQIERC